MSKLNNEKRLLIAILIVAGLLRFYNFLNIPITHDGFSALLRTNYRSFSEVIEFGVKPDVHPAGVQVLLYSMVKWFGDSAWVLQLPFLLMGMASIFLAYNVAKKMFHAQVGVLVAVVMATSEFTITYSQILRPYASGLFLILIVVNLLVLYIRKPVKFYQPKAIFLAVFLSLCAYNHYFSLLTAALLGGVLIIYSPKEYRLHSLGVGVVAVILFLPHLPVSLRQIGDDISGWVSVPTPYFWLDFLYYVCNYSAIVAFVLFAVMKWGLLDADVPFKLRKEWVLVFLLFFLPYSFGYFYSVHVSALIQKSALIFGFPFLIMALFSHVRFNNKMVFSTVILIIAVLNCYALIKERNYYTNFYNSIYQHASLDYTGNVNLKNANVPLLFYSDKDKHMFTYYCEKGIEDQIRWYDDMRSAKDLQVYLDSVSRNSDSLYFAAFFNISPNVISNIQQYYPFVCFKRNYYQGQTYLFAKKPNKRNNVKLVREFDATDFDYDWLNVHISRLTFVDRGVPTLELKGKDAYGPIYNFKLSQVLEHPNDLIEVSAVLKGDNEKEQGMLVLDLVDSKRKRVYFTATPIAENIEKRDENGWRRVSHVYSFADVSDQEIDSLFVECTLWNQAEESLYLKRMEVNYIEGNPVLYWVAEKEVPKRMMNN